VVDLIVQSGPRRVRCCVARQRNRALFSDKLIDALWDDQAMRQAL
jgi:hypothetical protein